MAKSVRKQDVAKARKAVARARSRYTKAVAKGERQIRDVRALVDEKVSRAKAAYELRENELAETERAVAEKAEKSAAKRLAAKGIVTVGEVNTADEANGEQTDASEAKLVSVDEVRASSPIAVPTGKAGTRPHS